MKNIARIILLVVVFALIIAVMDGFYILREGQQAVITQFGAPVGNPVTEAGLHLKTPFIQDVRYFEKNGS